MFFLLLWDLFASVEHIAPGTCGRRGLLLLLLLLFLRSVTLFPAQHCPPPLQSPSTWASDLGCLPFGFPLFLPSSVPPLIAPLFLTSRGCQLSGHSWKIHSRYGNCKQTAREPAEGESRRRTFLAPDFQLSAFLSEDSHHQSEKSLQFAVKFYIVTIKG